MSGQRKDGFSCMPWRSALAISRGRLRGNGLEGPCFIPIKKEERLEVPNGGCPQSPWYAATQNENWSLAAVSRPPVSFSGAQ